MASLAPHALAARLRPQVPLVRCRGSRAAVCGNSPPPAALSRLGRASSSASRTKWEPGLEQFDEIVDLVDLRGAVCIELQNTDGFIYHPARHGIGQEQARRLELPAPFYIEYAPGCTGGAGSRQIAKSGAV